MIVDFEIDHLKAMDLKESQLILGAHTIDQYKDINGQAKTLIIDNKIIACGGIETLWKGVGEAWLILSEHVFDYRLAVALKCRRMFPAMTRDYHRVQALVLTSFDKGIKIVKFLGFKSEGLLEQYGPDKEDYYRYVILR